MNNLKRVVALTFFLFLIFTFSVGAIDIGDYFPNIPMRDQAGNAVKISDFKGQNVLVAVYYMPLIVDSPKMYVENFSTLEKAGIKTIIITTPKYVTEIFEQTKAVPLTITEIPEQDGRKILDSLVSFPIFLLDKKGKIILKETVGTEFSTIWEKICSKLKLENSLFNYPKLVTGSYSAHLVEYSQDLIVLESKINELTGFTPFTKKSSIKLLNEPNVGRSPQYFTIYIGDKLFSLKAVSLKQIKFLDTLYIDYNQNRDLTDDGSPLEFELDDKSDPTRLTKRFKLGVPTDFGEVLYEITYISTGSFAACAFKPIAGFMTEIMTDAGPVKALLIDTDADADYTDKTDVLLIDFSNNGIFDSRFFIREWVKLYSPLKVGDMTYSIQVSEDGRVISLQEKVH